MEKVKTISENKNFTAVNIGALNQLLNHSYVIPGLGQEVKGKIFLGERVNATGMEVSLQTLPPHTGIPFLHTHNENEEMYIILKGNGEFQIDSDTFAIEEGSIVRVAPDAKRSWKNTSDSEMIVMVIQAKIGSLNKFYGADGSIV